VGRSQILPETVSLEQEAVPHAAIPACTHHFFPVKMLREAEFNSTRVLQALQLRKGLPDRRVSRPQPPKGGDALTMSHISELDIGLRLPLVSVLLRTSR